jgi:hypothetical protein
MSDAKLEARLIEAKMEIRLAELRVLAAATTVAVGEIADLIHQGRSGPRQSLARALKAAQERIAR